MKKFTFILTSMLFLLVGGVKADPVNLNLSGGQNVHCENKGSYTEVTFNHNTFNGKWNGYYGDDWVTTLPSGKKHRFVFTFNSGVSSDLTLHFVVTTVLDWNNDNSKKIIDVKIGSGVTSFQYDVETEYGGVFLINTGTSGAKLGVVSVTREEIGSGGGGSASNGKTNVSYNIPGKNVLFSDSFDENLNKWGSLNTDNGSVEWNDSEGHSATGCMKVVNNSDRNKEQWKIQRRASFSSTISQGTTFYISFYIKCESGTGSIRCSTTGNDLQYQGDQDISTAWQHIFWPVTAEGNIDGFCLDMAHTANTYYIDDVEVYTNAATGGSNVFTSDDQVANISSSAFSSLAEGDYICADVTGTPEPIKLVCNGSDYPLTQFNGGTLWGIKATDEMVTALKANDSQFKGHDLTLNGIDIYKTVALGEGDNSTALASKINNVFVELTRSFTGGTWNTVCLPFVPTPAQANELFGSGYKLAEFTASGTDKMTFTTIDLENDNFVAGKPYLVYPTAKLSHSNKVLANVSITETEGLEDKDNGYKFKGSFEPKSFSENLNLYRFIASGNELKKPTGGTLKSLRCYFEYPSGGNARSFTIDEEGGTTGINAVNGEGFMVNGYYNLNGQRVAKPTKGLYIVNGKKVVIK